jgi:hypothetical protein
VSKRKGKERKGENFSIRLDALPDEQEGYLIYMRAALSTSSSLYGNGDVD